MNPEQVEQSRRLQEHLANAWASVGNSASTPATSTTTTSASTTTGVPSDDEEHDASGDGDSPMDDVIIHGPVNDPLIYRDLYAPSGFDIVKILIQVQRRPHPKIHLGAIDSSCALLLCDLTRPDLPIVYCSDPFETLTGYTSPEILGRNCRFLQSPSGQVTPGVKRQYTDDGKVHELKTLISAREEAQMQILNYKKGGQPFMNVLTTIPIRWDGPDLRYMVGFQVDLSDCYVREA